MDVMELREAVQNALNEMSSTRQVCSFLSCCANLQRKTDTDVVCLEACYAVTGHVGDIQGRRLAFGWPKLVS